MSSIGTALLKSLGSGERQGDFCAGGVREVMPTIAVEGVGGISFPILAGQGREQLVAIAEAAPYGLGEETVIDCKVRRTWQVESAKAGIGGRHWEKSLAGLIADGPLNSV